jgi:hypothetical protein
VSKADSPAVQVTSDLGPYAIIPRWLLAAVSPRAIQVFAALAVEGNFTTREASIGRRDLAEICQCSSAAVDRALKELVDAGAMEITEQWVTIAGRVTGRKTRDVNRYHLRFVQRGGLTSEEGGGLTSDEVSTSELKYQRESERRASHSLEVAAPNPPGTVEAIFEYWRAARGKSSRMTLTRDRVDKIQARLKRFAPAELRQAIDGVAYDPWEDRHLHDDLTIIFRNDGVVEKYLDMLERRPQPGVKPHPADVRRARLLARPPRPQEPPEPPYDVEIEVLGEEG